MCSHRIHTSLLLILVTEFTGSSAVVSFSDHTLVQLFKRSHHGARGSLSTPLPLFFDFNISFFSMFAFPSGMGKHGLVSGACQKAYF